MERQCLKISNIKLSINHSEKDIKKAIVKSLRLSKADTFEYEIFKKSVDSRNKPDVFYVYSILVFKLNINGMDYNLEAFFKKNQKQLKNVNLTKQVIYEFPYSNVEVADDRPVVIGLGPAGLFAAFMLSLSGCRPIVYERGLDVDSRKTKVESFWNGGELDTECNVQFGEGGAGTFSDGKLNTQITDTYGRIRYMLDTFVRFGAKKDILYVNKPHIGTDVLANVVKSMREEIIKLGGEINFGCCLTGLLSDGDRILGVVVRGKDGTTFERKASQVCLAIGHSARDTFEWLHNSGIAMEPKPFAVGVRIMHNQNFINNNAYGYEDIEMNNLPVADYKVTYNSEASGVSRGVYSFCMCPGGYVVNASSEEGRIAVNGMSYSGRDSANANSALIVTVGPQDYGDDVLDGVKFQRMLEKAAFDEGKGKIPVQLFGDFEAGKVSEGYGNVIPCVKGQMEFADLNKVLPDYISCSLKDAIHGFDRFIKGFDNPDAVLAGVESRTSSPVRITRDDNHESVRLKGLYPCGEGAGYAGGITSASVDGIKVAEAMIKSRLLT